MAEAKLPAHPSRRLGIQIVCLGALLLLGAILSMRNATVGLGFGAFGVLLAWLGARLLRDGPTAQSVNVALDRLNRGHFEEAEAILDAIPPSRRASQMRRAI